MLAPCVPNWRSDSLPSASWCSPCRRGPIMPTATTQSRPSTWKGVVTELHLLTPHSWMYVEVAKPDGQKQLWALEAGGQARLLKIGVSAENPRPGDGLPACLHRRSRSPRRRRRSDRGPDRAPTSCTNSRIWWISDRQRPSPTCLRKTAGTRGVKSGRSHARLSARPIAGVPLVASGRRAISVRTCASRWSAITRRADNRSG